MSKEKRGLFGLGIVPKIGESFANAVSGPVKHYEFEALTPTPFEIRNNCRVTLYQDAHCEDDYPPKIITDYGTYNTEYIPQNCFEDIYRAILDAKLFVYITGWSVDTKISLLRRTPIFAEEAESGMMPIGNLLKFKAEQGVKVLLHVWDEALSVNIGSFQTSGIMVTYDEETKKYFQGTGVQCKLSYRTGSTKDNQFLWTHHQKSVICDAPALDTVPQASLLLSNSASNLYSSNLYNFSSQQQAPQPSVPTEITEAHYSAPNDEGHRFAIASFMTSEHNYTKLWDDAMTNSHPHHVSIFRPNPPPGWHILGDIAERTLNAHPNPLTKIMVVKEPPPTQYFPPILAPPASYQQVWPPSGVYKSKSGSVVFWRPIPPPDYQALGYIVSDSTTMPDVNIIRCVHKDAILPAHAVYEEDQRPIWRNKRQRSKKTSTGGPEFGLWNLIPKTEGLISGTFCVRGGYKLPRREIDVYWCLRIPPITVDVCDKPNDFEAPYRSVHNLPAIQAPTQKRRIIAFVGGLDLTYGRWDTPKHPLFRTLDKEHRQDFLHGWGLNQDFGPREPWHDIHSKLEGPIARDVLVNFEQRWRRQAKTHLPHLDPYVISIKEEEIPGEESWSCRLCRSIDTFSAEIPAIENGIQHSYVSAIRTAKRFIYIENQYFMGSSKHWHHEKNTCCMNLVPYEIAARIAQSIRDRGEPVRAYILLPLYPEGYPSDGAIQEQLRWQWNSMVMMYDLIHKALEEVGSHANPMDYLMFLCVGQREVEVLSKATRKDPPSKSREATLAISRRVPIYVHSKLMIIDDEYVILGSANINERSMAGDRDSEICVESWQGKYVNVPHARGGVHQFRMSIWSEHTNVSLPEFLEPNKAECMAKIRQIAEDNWTTFASDAIVNMESHLMRYPIRVSQRGKLVADPHCFPDTKAPVMGQSSLTMPDLLTA